MECQAKIKKTAMDLLDSIAIQVLKAIARQASELCEHGKIKVLGAKSIESAVRIFVPGEMAKYSIEEANAACLKYQQYEKPT